MKKKEFEEIIEKNITSRMFYSRDIDKIWKWVEKQINKAKQKGREEERKRVQGIINEASVLLKIDKFEYVKEHL